MNSATNNNHGQLTPAEEKQLNQLTFYIEHNLIRQMLEDQPEWVMEREDPTWQAVCWYYDLALKLTLGNEPEPLPVTLLRRAMASGTGPKYYCEYPDKFCIYTRHDLRNPVNSALDIFSYVHANSISLPAAPPSTRIPLTGFTGHMSKARRTMVMNLSLHKVDADNELVVFDDGQFLSAAVVDPIGDNMKRGQEPASAINTRPLGHATLDQPEVQSEIWRRWRHGWEFAQPLDIRTEDGRHFSGLDVIAALVPKYLEAFDQVDPMLSALSKWTEKDVVKQSVSKVLTAWYGARPEETRRQLFRLSHDARQMLEGEPLANAL